MAKSKNLILFIGNYKPFINILKKKGYHVKSVRNTIHLEKKIWMEKPDFIILFIDMLDFNGFDPIQYIPSQFIKRTLTVSETISPIELVKIIDKHVNSFRNGQGL